MSYAHSMIYISPRLANIIKGHFLISLWVTVYSVYQQVL